MLKTAVIIGSTGLIGNSLLGKMLANDNYKNVIALVRKPLLIHHPKLKVIEIDFENENENELQNCLQGDDLFICTGSTMKKAGSKEAFRAIDFDLPLRIATIASQNKMKKLLLISALGASVKSLFFYSKVKGELEQAVQLLPFASIFIFQPSILLGDRNEKRFLESVSQKIFRFLSFLFVGRLKKYAGTESYKVAESMIKQANSTLSGIHFINNETMLK